MTAKQRRFSGWPYTFRSRTLVILLLCSLTAGVISLAGSYWISRLNIRTELSASERDAAIYLLELDQKTSLTIDEMIRMAVRDNLTLTQLEQPEHVLTVEQREQLSQGAVLTVMRGLVSMPVTYVSMGSGEIVCIRLSRDFNLFFNAFVRIIFAIILCLTFFASLSILAAARIAKPISALTQATRQVKEGNFSVQLPEDQIGEIGELIHSFNGMTNTLSRTAYLQKDFISSISHEFRTPIASIRGFARLLQVPGLDESARIEYIGMIAKESDRLSRLSDTLLRLSALEQQMAPASLSVFRLDEQIRQVILRLQPMSEPQAIDWQLDLAPVSIESDCELLIQVWINLIQNAIKFSSKGGTIEIRVYETDAAVVEIADHGIGMDEATLQRIFDRFYQADASRSNDGVGLGLCLVKRILDILSGEIRARSTMGQGSVFRVRLPKYVKETTQ